MASIVPFTNTFPHISRFSSHTYLDSNKLRGSLPENIPENTKLEYLSVYDNQLTGSLPTSLRNLNALVHLDVASNSFEGPIPDELGEMTKLWLLFLSENPNLEKGEIPSTLAALTELKELSLRSTNREGPIPDFIGDSLIKLFMLDLGSNSFTGSIPENFGKLVDLEYLLVNNNPISGELPTTVSNMTSLYGVILDGTNLEGNVNAFCELPNFQDTTGSQYVYADCGGDAPELSCLCAFDCQCCDGGVEGGCSEPQLANLDGSWKNDFRRQNFEFFWIDEIIDEVNDAQAEGGGEA